MKSQSIPSGIPSALPVTAPQIHREKVVPTSPKMRQIVTDYAATHAFELKSDSIHSDKQKYH
jgi:hypothetical protein